MSGNAAGAPWTGACVPELGGRVAVVTGANTGVGYETVRVLAERGATVVLACRSEEKARVAARRLKAGRVETARLDLASLAEIRRAAEEIGARHGRIDLLINNAGVMDTPYGATADGFELQLGINHLGHFALTGLLLPALLAAPGSRVVNVSSLAHRRGRMNFADLGYTRHYKPNAAYCRSKLANLLFTFALQRRLVAVGASTIALAAHPGYARTELFRHESASYRVVYALVAPLITHSAAGGALPSLRAATDPSARGGEYYGPGGAGEHTGDPVLVSASSKAHDVGVQERLWSESEKLTGVAFSF